MITNSPRCRSLTQFSTSTRMRESIFFLMVAAAGCGCAPTGRGCMRPPMQRSSASRCWRRRGGALAHQTRHQAALISRCIAHLSLGSLAQRRGCLPPPWRQTAIWQARPSQGSLMQRDEADSQPRQATRGWVGPAPTLAAGQRVRAEQRASTLAGQRHPQRRVIGACLSGLLHTSCRNQPTRARLRIQMRATYTWIQS